MKTILEAIQTYPDQFISTCRARANTTPSSENKTNHLSVAMFIKHTGGRFEQRWLSLMDHRRLSVFACKTCRS